MSERNTALKNAINRSLTFKNIIKFEIEEGKKEDEIEAAKKVAKEKVYKVLELDPEGGYYKLFIRDSESVSIIEILRDTIITVDINKTLDNEVEKYFYIKNDEGKIYFYLSNFKEVLDITIDYYTTFNLSVLEEKSENIRVDSNKFSSGNINHPVDVRIKNFNYVNNVNAQNINAGNVVTKTFCIGDWWFQLDDNPNFVRCNWNRFVEEETNLIYEAITEEEEVLNGTEEQ